MTSVLLMVLAVFGGVATMNAAAAVAAPAATPQVVQQTGDEVGTQATYRCSWTATAQRVDANCSVVSGQVRLYGRCSNGGTYYTPWVGRGNWHLWVTCGSYRLLSFGFQSRG
ncbi:hypothetical protein ACFOWZ_17555 [Lentzea rhizosphaerae]|uniref:Ig-like domain-containing protein n=1 Tax=Lentzea rhizosphaerae TaxID=2041025 RepID=A0ABV8BSU2_9PSEU